MNCADDAALNFTSVSTVLFPSSLLWPISTSPKSLSLAVYQVVINPKMSTKRIGHSRGWARLPMYLLKQHAMNVRRGMLVYIHALLNTGTRWRWVVRFTHGLLYRTGKTPLIPWDRRLGGSHSLSGSLGEEKNLSTPSRIKHDSTIV